MMLNSPKVRTGGAGFLGALLITIGVLFMPVYYIGTSSTGVFVPFTDFLAGFRPPGFDTGLIHYLAWFMPMCAGIGLVVGVSTVLGGLDRATGRMLLFLTLPALVIMSDFLFQMVRNLLSGNTLGGEITLAFGYWVIGLGWVLVVYACGKYANIDTGEGESTST